MRSPEEVENAFRYHPNTESVDPDARAAQHEQVRDKHLRLALDMFDELPNCAERTIALRHLEQSMMYANAAIARHGR